MTLLHDGHIVLQFYDALFNISDPNCYQTYTCSMAGSWVLALLRTFENCLKGLTRLLSG